MIIGHYPTMERPAAVLYGAGDAELIMWLSAVGYLTEISNIFLDVRWFQLKVFGTPATLPYALNSLLLLVSYVVTRVLIMPIVTWTRVVPRYAQYKQAGQLTSFYVVTTGVGFITLMSVAYTVILLKPGVRAFIFYGTGKKDPKKLI
mmetsp:Transcript_20575/g.63990  ORF Transcript_20575/g.63990 Transcript_20575/m.63990 type:complete len:147 (-) Transcript_20575:10-450(-)